MKKIGLLTTLLVCGLLLTGCNNHQYEEEFSEYGLLQWPNGTITLEDFKKEGNIYSGDVWNEVFYKGIVGDTPENAAVMLVFKPDEILYTPYEKNTVLPENHENDIGFWTNLETFRKVTGLKEASPEYVGYFDGIYIFNPYAKFYKIKEERETKIKEKIENQTIEEPVVNIDHIDTEEERKERCKDDAMKQFNEIIPDGEFVNLVWEGLEKETRDESGRLTIIHGNFRIVYNKDGYEWFWPGLCETNFVEGNQKVIFNQSYMNI